MVLGNQTAFSIIICDGRKTEKHGLDMQGYIHARVSMEEGLLSVWVSQSISKSQSINEL